MKTNDIGFILGAIAGVALGMLVCFSSCTPDTTWHREAVTVGAAEYIINPKTGEVKWHWKIPPATQPTAKQEQTP